MAVLDFFKQKNKIAQIEAKEVDGAEVKALQAKVNALKAELEKATKALADAMKRKETSKPAPSKQKPMKDGHEYVDLGLSVKWATCNVGASKPEEYGDYFAWAETKTKKEYTEENSKAWGKDRNDISGSSRYDAARANWGGKWRMPTEAEMQELMDKCTWKWTTQNGVKGYKVTGPNGNSIFLPAAGQFGSSLILDGSNGYYWSSTPSRHNVDDAVHLYFNSGNQGMLYGRRRYGQSVRPVVE